MPDSGANAGQWCDSSPNEKQPQPAVVLVIARFQQACSEQTFKDSAEWSGTIERAKPEQQVALKIEQLR